MKLRAVLVIVTAAMALPDVLQSQTDKRVWQSDIRIAAIEMSQARAGGAIATRFIVSAEGDDEARGVRLEILVPVGIVVLRNADGCKASASPVTGLSARLTCDLGDISSRMPREVVLSISSRASSTSARIAAFAFSDTPDPLPVNNFAERALPW